MKDERTKAATASWLRIFPSPDDAFGKHVRAMAEAESPDGAASFQTRLRRFYPKAIVRRRELSGEPEVWYVYRDGAWAHRDRSWWLDGRAARIEVSLDGWLVDANGVARGLLGLPPGELGDHHFTDLVAPGTLRDAEEVYRIISAGGPFLGTVLVRPLDGHTLAIDLNARREGDRLVAELRLSSDVPAFETQQVARPTDIDCRPKEDVAFSGYARSLLDRMPEPTVEGLALRLRRLYPHADVHAEPDRWVAERGPARAEPEPRWWEHPGLPRVAYDGRGLILDANPAAKELLGSPLVGHHWHEFVTTGSSDAVDAMIEILRRAGGAESRFRMPDASGTLMEFDSFTRVEDEDERLVTIMRPLG